MCRSAYFVNQISHRQIKDRQDNCIGREAQAPGLWGGVDAADLPMKLMLDEINARQIDTCIDHRKKRSRFNG